MYGVSWGTYEYDEHNGVHGDVRKKKGSKTFTSIELALVCFINHDLSTKWDWITMDLDKTSS